MCVRIIHVAYGTPGNMQSVILATVSMRFPIGVLLLAPSLCFTLQKIQICSASNY